MEEIKDLIRRPEELECIKEKVVQEVREATKRQKRRVLQPMARSLDIFQVQGEAM